MKLGQSLDQIDLPLGEIQAFLTTIITGLRDRYPDTHVSVMQQISDMKEVGPPEEDASSSSV